jgi:hypothetical protein
MSALRQQHRDAPGAASIRNGASSFSSSKPYHYESHRQLPNRALTFHASRFTHLTQPNTLISLRVRRFVLEMFQLYAADMFFKRMSWRIASLVSGVRGIAVRGQAGILRLLLFKCMAPL